MSFILGLPHVCGGGSNYEPFDECWQYSPSDDTWTMTSDQIPREVNSAASTYHPAWGIIMAGGISCQFCDETTANVTTTKNAVDFEELAPMPTGISSTQHCIAAIDADTIFTTGLGIEEDESFMYYRSTGQWVSVPNLPTGRSGMGCGVVMDGSGRAEVVVVGGIDKDAFGLSGFLDTVEIFNVEEGSWRTGISRTYVISSETVQAPFFLSCSHQPLPCSKWLPGCRTGWRNFLRPWWLGRWSN